MLWERKIILEKEVSGCMFNPHPLLTPILTRPVIWPPLSDGRGARPDRRSGRGRGHAQGDPSDGAEARRAHEAAGEAHAGETWREPLFPTTSINISFPPPFFLPPHQYPLSLLINPSCLSPRILLIPKIYHRRSIILTIAPAGPRKSIEQAGGVGCEGARHPGPIKDQQGRRDHPHGAGQSCGGTGQECQGYRERGKWRNRAAGCRDSHSFPRNTAMSFIQYPPHRF